MRDPHFSVDMCVWGSAVPATGKTGVSELKSQQLELRLGSCAGARESGLPAPGLSEGRTPC